ncbi:MAG: CoA-transferase [Candidatus Promineifilaceae bacterium]|nr:CoA-transferase [Candidatus Promineifilaceae bacterium]
MIDKTTSLEEALHLVRDNQVIGLGGMTIYRRPVAFVKALIRRDELPRDLTLLTFTGGLASDMLIGAGLVARTRCCYFGLETFGLAPMFTSAVSDGMLAIIEESEASIANGLRATMAGTGFMPSLAWVGTDMYSVRPDVQMMADPYSGNLVTAFPAISCDITVIHALQADRLGNVRLGGNPTIDFELANVAKTVIITAEEVVEAISAPIDIPGHAVTAVVSLPKGAWPTSCYPLYPIDGEEILRYIGACNAGQFHEYMYN